MTEADLLGRRELNTDIDSVAGYLTGRRVLVTGAGGSIGLARWPFMPAARQRSISSGSACAVSATIFTPLTSGVARMTFVASMPDITGIEISIKIRSGAQLLAMSTASAPFSAQ